MKHKGLIRYKTEAGGHGNQVKLKLKDKGTQSPTKQGNTVTVMSNTRNIGKYNLTPTTTQKMCKDRHFYIREMRVRNRCRPLIFNTKRYHYRTKY